MKTLSREHVHYLLDANHPPAITVAQNQRLLVQTERADGMFLTPENPVFRDHEQVMSVRSNPVTGPIFVEDAQPGDLLAVTFHDITPCDDGSPAYVTYVPSQGIFSLNFCPAFDFPPETKWCAAQQGVFTMDIAGQTFSSAALPFIGTLAVAPKEDVFASYAFRKDVMGNVDCKHVTAGSTVVLPVNRPGALLSLGDMHAAMGDGEVMGCAAECRGSVVLSLKVIKPGHIPFYDWPQVNTATFFGSIACVENNIDQAIRHSVFDLTRRVEHGLDIPFMQAYMLVGQHVRLEICQLTGSFATALAYLERNLFPPSLCL